MHRKHLQAGCALSVIVVSASLAAAQPAAEEWTFERARNEWKPMTRAVQHVGVPGHEWQAGVFWDGALFFGPEAGVRKNPAMKLEATPLGNNLLHISIGYGDTMRLPDRHGLSNAAVTRSLEEGRVPIPHVRTRDGDLLWEEVVFADLLGRKLEEGIQPHESDRLVVHARFTVRNNSGRAATGHLWMHFGDTSQVQLGYKAGQGDQLAPAIAHRFEPPFGVFEDGVRYAIPKPARGELVWHDEIGPPEGMKQPAQKVIEWSVPLRPRQEAHLELVVPYAAVDRATAEGLLKLNYDSGLGEVRRFWRSIEDGPGTIVTPDEFVNQYLGAVVGQMSQQVGFRHKAGVWMYKTSPNHYEHYWPCNAAKALPTLDLRGLTRYTRPVMKSFVDTQSEDVGKLTRMISGKPVSGEGFAVRPGFLGNFRDWTANTLLLSHGLEMWDMASHFRITRDRQWLGSGPGSPLQALLDGFDWVMDQRRRTMREENGRKVPHWGLLPAASAHDWLSGNTIFNDAFCIFGMIETVRLLKEIDHPRAAEMAAQLNEYRACLRQRYIEARDHARPVPMPGGTQLPYVPRDVYELDWTKPDWTYTGYGPLRAGAWGALDPTDELVNQALAFLEKGMPKGEGYYFKIAKTRDGQPTADENFRSVSDPEAPRHYMWRHYVEYETMWPIGFDLFLQRDDLPRFFEWLFNNLAMVLHQNYRVGVESLDGVPSCAPGDGERWRGIRDMFVNERGGYDGSQQSLWLLQAIPRSWLKPGSRLAVKDMGTHFGGRVNLDAQMANDGNSVAVTAALELAAPPTEIRMRLRSGDGRPLKSAQISGAPAAVLDGDTIRLPGELRGRYKIVGRFQ